MVDVEAQEVVGLQQHVAELGVGDALLGSLEAGLDRLLGHHLVDGEVLADVAQVLEHRQRAEPVGVVEQQGPALGQVEEPPQLGPDALEVGGESRGSSSLRSSYLPPGSPIMPVPPPASAMGRWPALLEPAQVAELEQVAHVEAVGRRVEAGVEGEARLVETFRQVGVGHLVDQAAEGEVLRKRGHASDAAIRR